MCKRAQSVCPRARIYPFVRSSKYALRSEDSAVAGALPDFCLDDLASIVLVSFERSFFFQCRCRSDKGHLHELHDELGDNVFHRFTQSR